MTFNLFRKSLISLVVLFEIIIIVAWGAPKSRFLSPWTVPVRAVVRPYMQWSGMWQAWNMFSPDPRNFDTRIHVQATMNDGTSRVWSPPELTRTGFFARHRSERYRKWASDHLQFNRESKSWSDAVNYIKGQLKLLDPDKEVVFLQFSTENRKILDEGPRFSDASPWKSKIFFEYPPADEPDTVYSENSSSSGVNP